MLNAALQLTRVDHRVVAVPAFKRCNQSGERIAYIVGRPVIDHHFKQLRLPVPRLIQGVGFFMRIRKRSMADIRQNRLRFAKRPLRYTVHGELFRDADRSKKQERHADGDKLRAHVTTSPRCRQVP